MRDLLAKNSLLIILIAILLQNKDRLNSAIIYDRDYNYDYFGFKTLERAYLMTCDKKIIERPQHMIMRVSLGTAIVTSESEGVLMERTVTLIPSSSQHVTE